jgi:hypothetical protein
VRDNVSVPCKPRQIEFSRLNLEYTVMSKRRLTELVGERHVHGWDDPRMPTVAGLRRRGYTPGAIRDFCERVGVTKSDNLVEMALLESAIRDDLDATAPRRMAVLRPLKVVIVNYPEDRTESIEARNHPKDESWATRSVPFGREIYIDRTDFEEIPPKGFKRLIPGGEVRLRNAYVIRCEEVVKDADGEILELRVSADLDTLGRNPEGRKVKGVIHWVSADMGLRAEVRLYDRLFRVPVPGAGGADFRSDINPESLRILTDAVLEPALRRPKPASASSSSARVTSSSMPIRRRSTRSSTSPSGSATPGGRAIHERTSRRRSRPAAGRDPWHERRAADLGTCVSTPRSPRRQRSCGRFGAMPCRPERWRKVISEEQGQNSGPDPRFPGIEESSRDWSVYMTLDHLVMVNTADHGADPCDLRRSQSRCRDRSGGRDRPHADAGPDRIQALGAAVERYTDVVERLGTLRSRERHPHPWFGPLTARQWHAVAAIHNRTHRLQIEKILSPSQAAAAMTPRRDRTAARIENRCR